MVRIGGGGGHFVWVSERIRRGPVWRAELAWIALAVALVATVYALFIARGT